MPLLLRVRFLFQRVGRDALVLWYACRDPGTPIVVKLLAVVIALYVIYPIDFMPDLFPLLGWIDDVTLLALAIPAVLKLVPVQSAQRARQSAGGTLSRWKFWPGRR